jgi:hypothetical protein
MKTLASAPDRVDLVRRLRLVRPDSVRQWGRMSAPQMICHLADAFRMAMAEKDVSPATGLLQRTVIKGIALYAPLRWPPGILTRPEIDQTSGGTCPGDFRSDVADVEQLLQRMATWTPAGPWPTHPIFGRMSSRDWLRWGYLHTDHHLRQFGS